MLENSIARVGALAALALLLVTAGLAEASGTYTGRPPRPPSAVDRASYALGKEIFAGTFEPGTVEPREAASSSALEVLQERLPLQARPRAHFLDYGDRLSEEQVAALRYYLEKRYRVR